MKKNSPSLLSLILLVTFALILFLIPLNFAGAQSEGQKWAIIIGINDYMENVTPLECAVNDSREMEKALIETARFPEENVILLSSDQRQKRLPTKVNIAKWISYVKSKVTPSDTFVFFFSGHGIQMGEEGYLLTFEADPYSEDTLDASCLSISDLAKYFRNLKSSRMLLFLDACRDDPRQGEDASSYVPGGDRELGLDRKGISSGIKSRKADAPAEIARDEGSSNNPLTEKFSNSFVIKNQSSSGGEECFSATFFSCDLGQRSYEWRERSMGFFTYFLIKGIRGEAANSSGDITLKNLEDYLCPVVTETVENEKRNRQTPRVVVNGPESARQWAVARGVNKSVVYEPGKLAVVSSADTPKGGGGKNLTQAPLPRAQKLKYGLDIIGNTVEGREYNELTHEVDENTYEVDIDALQEGLRSVLDGSPLLERSPDENAADIWVFFNVCPTQEMCVDLMARDCKTGATISKQCLKLYRPHPGKKGQIVDSSLKALREKFLGNLETKLRNHYQSAPVNYTQEQ